MCIAIVSYSPPFPHGRVQGPPRTLPDGVHLVVRSRRRTDEDARNTDDTGRGGEQRQHRRECALACRHIQPSTAHQGLRTGGTTRGKRNGAQKGERRGKGASSRNKASSRAQQKQEEDCCSSGRAVMTIRAASTPRSADVCSPSQPLDHRDLLLFWDLT